MHFLVCVRLCGRFLILLGGVHWTLTIESSLMTLHPIPQVGVGRQGGRKDLFAFHLGSWWMQSLATRWQLDVDKAKC